MKILRVVTLASISGRYGGPFDTATRQGACVAQVDGSIDFCLISGFLRNDSPPPADRAEYVRVRRIIPSPGFTGVFSFRALRRLFARVRDSDLIHISLAREMIPLCALVIARLLRKPVILQPHGMLTSRTSMVHRVLDAAMRPLFRADDTWLALTPTEAAELRSWRRTDARIEVLGNPIPLDGKELESLRHIERGREALFLARLHPRKRVEDFVAAADFASTQDWPERYVVIGPDQGSLDRVRNALLQNPLLSYEGVLAGTEVTARVARTGVVVLPSRDEPWGNVLATAIALRVPVVVTRSAALAPLVEKSASGIVVNDEDPIAIARAVHALLSQSAPVGPGSNSPILGHYETGLRLRAIYADAYRSDPRRDVIPRKGVSN